MKHTSTRFIALVGFTLAAASLSACSSTNDFSLQSESDAGPPRDQEEAFDAHATDRADASADEPRPSAPDAAVPASTAEPESDEPDGGPAAEGEPELAPGALQDDAEDDASEGADTEGAEQLTEAERDEADAAPTEVGSGTALSGDDAESECEPGSRELCWEDELGVSLGGDPRALRGSCRLGERSCSADGQWGSCVGAVAPRASDSCATAGADDDCDGVPNVGCECVTGEVRSCGSDVGACVAGTQTCIEQQWGPCEGAVEPAREDSCEIPGDDADCDGVANSGCACVGDATEPCGECGTRSCEPATRSWGECVGQAIEESCWQDPSGQALPALPLGQATGSCTLGTRSCGADGTWGSCSGAVAPEPRDSCEVVGDDANCNGIPNEGCPCVGDDEQSCGDCGTQQCDPAVRDWGECEPRTNPPERRCEGVGILEVCGADGRWEQTDCTSADDECVGSCAVVGGVAECTVSAVDRDGDAVGSAACSVAPGADCDDADRAIRPGAVEVCDGLDNDCDGHTDLQDGLSLAGETVFVPGVINPKIAWNHQANEFGWVASRVVALSFGTLDVRGYVDESPTPFTPVSHPPSRYLPFDLAYGERSGEFLSVYQRILLQEATAQPWELALVNAESEQVQFRKLPAFGVVAARDGSDFVMATGGSTLVLATIDAEGVYQKRDQLESAAGSVAIATSGVRTGIAYVSDGAVRWIQANSANVLDASPAKLPGGGGKPAIAGTSEGFAIAWATDAGFNVGHYRDPRSTECGPVSIPFGDGLLDANDQVAIADTARGFLVLATDVESGSFELFRFSHDDCRLLDRVEMADGEPAAQLDLAAGGGYVGATWLGNGPEGVGGTHFRSFSDLLCE